MNTLSINKLCFLFPGTKNIFFSIINQLKKFLHDGLKKKHQIKYKQYRNKIRINK